MDRRGFLRAAIVLPVLPRLLVGGSGFAAPLPAACPIFSVSSIIPLTEEMMGDLDTIESLIRQQLAERVAEYMDAGFLS